jgi:hypothetical protein
LGLFVIPPVFAAEWAARQQLLCNRDVYFQGAAVCVTTCQIPMLDRSALRDFRPLIMTPGHDGTGRYLSEDYAFCRRWEETMGGNVCRRQLQSDAPGAKVHRGGFVGPLLRDVRFAVTAPVGMGYVVNGLDNLTPNPLCAV